jgi:hypothetical protein
MVFNAIGFARGVKGDDGFRREVNGLEAVLRSRVEEEVRGRAVRRHGLRWEVRPCDRGLFGPSESRWAGRPGGLGCLEVTVSMNDAFTTGGQDLPRARLLIEPAW